MATLREIKGRLKSIENIEKITKTMKTVASTKLSYSQKAMEKAKVYSISQEEIFFGSEIKVPEQLKTLYIVCSSDKGLCGGIHSQLTRVTRELVEKNPEGHVVILGDKAKMQLTRYIPRNIIMSFTQIGKDIPTFYDAQMISNAIIQSNREFDKADIIYNSFKSTLSYLPAIKTIYSENFLKDSKNYHIYEAEDNVLTNFKEFLLSTGIFSALVEGHACEISARRNAMDNASKNALEMIKKFKIIFNRYVLNHLYIY
ncbi:ATP synthase F1, gamma subunit [Pneumocystis carinii B80]|uniref:ATP synthase subunit gamma n=1 Tax=Pneumocystis carinii (strain B80) TaxID=1408658 RepID=A0A0W4ZQY1_PNEC8|nr:ATP synthase F1, gamma subunit [Pneumocystis carinii B80]KTW30769.1 ATP synthase F1, gamma subunit [Pneumocystis carinii B80]